jgi:hypothetical protein
MVALSMRKMRAVQKSRNTELETLRVAFPFISALVADVNPGRDYALPLRYRDAR